MNYYTKNVKNCLDNCDPRSAASVEYCQGMFVGLVAAMMDTGLTFDIAIQSIVGMWEQTYRLECLPESWRVYFSK